MPLSNEDWAEILSHTRTRVREVGLGDIDERITLDFRSTQSPGVDFLRYLDSLISAVEERSTSTHDRALGILRNHVQTEDGTPIQGIEVSVDDRDFGVFATHRIDLADQRDLSAGIEELTRLRHDLISTGLIDEQSNG